VVSVLEKMFHANGRRGKVKTDILPALLREFNPDIEVEPKEFELALKENGLQGMFFSVF